MMLQVVLHHALFAVGSVFMPEMVIRLHVYYSTVNFDLVLTFEHL